MNQKICSGPCKRKLELGAENFRKDVTQASGYKSRCKSCMRSVKATKWPSVDAFDKAQGMVETSRSTLYKDGEIVQEWVKVAKSKEDGHAAFLEALAGLDAKWDKPPAIKKPRSLLSDDLLTVIPLGDPHIGLLSWGHETGQDFDLHIAETNLISAVDHLVSLAPRAKRALLINLGDFFHADNSSNQTTHGTRVDVDGRWSKVLRVGIRIMRRAIEKLLETHEEVTVICEIGNHDTHSAVMLALALEQFYEHEPRVTIDTSPAKFHWYRFGRNLLGVTHGDTAKMKDLPAIMACDRAEDWGQTTYRYFYTGHLHHDKTIEYPGVIVETFRTLAPADAWHKGQGYRSGQDLKLDVIHKEYGRINRHTVGIRQLWDL